MSPYDPENAPTRRAPPSSGTGPLMLQVVGEGVFVLHTLPASGNVVIGRSEEADVRVDDPSISRRHAVLHVGPPMQIEDLDSANGTRVGDRTLRPRELVTVSPGEMIDLGSVMAVVQPGGRGQRPRRLWPHGYFEARVEDECLRCEKTGGEFSVARLHQERAGAERIVESVLAGLLDSSDMLASYAPGEYEVLLADRKAADTERFLAQVTRALSSQGAPVRLGVATYPRDGRDVSRLMARACDEAVGKPRLEPTRSTIVVEDAAMVRLHGLVDRVARGQLSVLLLGETGVGKEVMAETIHRRSPRADKPLVRLSCAAFSESLLESELFGHEKGAFTGASQAKPGLIETAHGGTVFLDEVGEMSSTVQVKLLRVIEERQVQRVGALKPRTIDVRFIAATHRDLELEVEQGRFRQDLYFRLNGFSLVIPPLRERVGEIAALAHALLRRAGEQTGDASVPTLSPEVLAQLERYSWPGNIRELRNVIERAALLAAGGPITLEHLPMDKMSAKMAAAPPSTGSVRPSPRSSGKLRDDLEAVERGRIVEALAECSGNQSRAAKRLGISRGQLLDRLDAYGIPRPRKGSKDR